MSVAFVGTVKTGLAGLGSAPALDSGADTEPPPGVPPSAGPNRIGNRSPFPEAPAGPLPASGRASSGSTQRTPGAPWAPKPLPSPSSRPRPTGRSVEPPLPPSWSSLCCSSCSMPCVCCLSPTACSRSCCRRPRSPSSADWMRWSMELSRWRSRSFSARWFLLSPMAVCNSPRSCFTCATSVATVSRGVSPSMPSAFISSGVSWAVPPPAADWSERPDVRWMPRKTSSAATGIISHLSRPLLFMGGS